MFVYAFFLRAYSFQYSVYKPVYRSTYQYTENSPSGGSSYVRAPEIFEISWKFLNPPFE